CWTAWAALTRESALRRNTSWSAKPSTRPWWKQGWRRGSPRGLSAGSLARPRPRRKPRWRLPATQKRIRSVARNRARTRSFEEMLQVLRTSYQERLAPPLGGFVYRFTIFLPLLSEGQEVFTRRHQYLLADLFHKCMRGYTETASEGHPPWYGSWAPSGEIRPVIDSHTLMVVYTPQ